MLRRYHPLCLALLLLGTAAALFALWTRHRAEGRSRAVELVLDYGQVRGIAAGTGTPVAELLERFRGAGITGVALTEETLGDLQAAGALDVEPRPGGWSVRAADPSLAERLRRVLPRYLPAAGTGPGAVEISGPEGRILAFPGRWDDYRTTPTGLDEAEAAQVRAAGLAVVGRLNNPVGLTPAALRRSLADAKRLGVRTVVFAGEEVLGFRGLVRETAAALRELDLLYGSVEFGKQRGDELLSREAADRLVRVHSISAGEMPRLAPGEAVERYVRAAAERNIRLCYVRLPNVVTAAPLDDALDYVRSIARGTVSERLGLGPARPFPEVWTDPGVRAVVRIALALGIAAGAVLLLAALIPLRPGAQVGLTVAGGAVCIALALSDVGLADALLALVAATVFPTLGPLLFPQPVGAFADPSHPAHRESTPRSALVDLAAMACLTLAGAVLLSALLSELPYLVKVRSFVGIKAATVLPILLVGAAYLSGASGAYPGFAAERADVTRRGGEFFSEPVRVWHALAGVVGIVALALLVARSGNDPGVGVSDLELRFRSVLDRVLDVRPRTKEFLVGHPALLLALLGATRPALRRWLLPLLLVGLIGQTGMLNSFCHLHTPIKLTVIRTFHGLWLGGLIGLAAVAAAAWLLRRGPAARAG